MHSEPDPSAPSPLFSRVGANPLFHAAWLFALGITAANFCFLRPSWLLLALALSVVLCALAAFRAQRIAWLPLATVWVILGCWCAEMEPHPAPAPQLAALSDGLLRTVEGTVTDAGPVRAEIEQNLDAHDAATTSSQTASQTIDLHISTLEVVTDADDAQARIDGTVRLTIRWPSGEDSDPPLPLACGKRIRANVRLLPPAVYHDPNVWSRRDFLLDQGITATATVRAAAVESIPADGKRQNLSFGCRIQTAQHTVSSRLLSLPARMRTLPAALRLSPDDAVMLDAMVTGDRTFLTHSLRVGFERTGSFHLLVVSGFHLALVAAGVFFIARRLRVPPVPATILTFAASCGYALFTGFGVPVQRSLWVVSIYLLGRLFYRDRSPLNSIGFAALCLLVASPRSLFDASLQMTLLAVIAIAGIATPMLQSTIHPYLKATRDLRLVAVDSHLPPRIAQYRLMMRMAARLMQAAIGPRLGWRVFPWCVRFLLRTGEVLVVSVVVELVMALPMALYFHRITVFALPVNIVILPLLSFLMPAALLTLLALAIWPAAATVPAIAVALLLHFGVGLVNLFGSFSDFRIPGPLPMQSAAFCALLAAAIALARGGPMRRRGAWAALLLASFIAVMPRPVDHPRDALLVEAIDVGQGDSLLLITPDGHTLLIDAGGFGGGPHQAQQNFDIGEEVVSQVLWSRGIRHLDAIALTHAHSDHMGGMPAVFRNFHPTEFWIGNNPHVPAYDDLLVEAKRLHVQLRTLRAGDAFQFSGTSVDVLAPFRGYEPGDEPTNNDSLVLRVGYGTTSVLLEGDAEAPVEQAMLAEPGLASTLLKVGHHGSVTSTQPEFLARVAPQWAVISCGLRNRYGHPRQEVLEELQAASVHTLRTDIDGAVCFRLDGKSMTADPACAGSFR
jgi:competence protein ComEC